MNSPFALEYRSNIIKIQVLKILSQIAESATLAFRIGNDDITGLERYLKVLIYLKYQYFLNGKFFPDTMQVSVIDARLRFVGYQSWTLPPISSTVMDHPTCQGGVSLQLSSRKRVAVGQAISVSEIL